MKFLKSVAVLPNFSISYLKGVAVYTRKGQIWNTKIG
jgi:hypothetical protein